MDLSIIIPSYNTKDLTIRCLKSIVNQYKDQLEKREFEIIVVDNGSSDGTVKYLRQSASGTDNLLRKKKVRVPQISENHKTIKLIENRTNLGFSKGNNIGAKKAGGKYLFFLNSDTEILDNGLLGMIDFLEKNERVGILGGRLENVNGSAQKSFGKFYNLWNTFLWLFLGEKISFGKNIRTEKRVDWVSGGSMMIKSDLFKRLSGFDENFFMYIEDMELCFRAKKLGFSTLFYPGIKIIHKHQGSSNRTYAILNIYKGLLYFYKKHKSFWEYLLLRLMLKKKAVLGILVGVLTNNNYLKKTFSKAVKI